MSIRKSLFLACLSMFSLIITACSSVKNNYSQAANFSDATVTPLQSIVTPAATVAPTAVISPTTIPIQYELLTHSVTSHNGKSITIANTKRETYNDWYDSNEIIDKIVIQNEDSTFEINNIVGYYGDMCWSNDDTKLSVSYYGRNWSSFTIFNAISATPLFSEVSFNEIKSFFEREGIVFDYKENENRPDAQIVFQEWSEDSKSIKVKYSIIDAQWQTQSGTFWYDLDTGKMKDLEQNPPYEAG